MIIVPTMETKHALILVLACLLLAACTTALVCDKLLVGDKVEVLHDQLLIAESKLETRNEDYNRLLEKIGGADFTPYVPLPQGKSGAK